MKKEMRGIFFPEMIANTIVHRPFPLPGPAASLHIPGGWFQALAPLSSPRNRVGDTQTMPLSLQIYCEWLFSPLECSKRRWKPFPRGSGHCTSWPWLFRNCPFCLQPWHAQNSAGNEAPNSQLEQEKGLKALPRGVGFSRKMMPSQGCRITVMKEKQKENQMSWAPQEKK